MCFVCNLHYNSRSCNHNCSVWLLDTFLLNPGSSVPTSQYYSYSSTPLSSMPGSVTPPSSNVLVDATNRFSADSATSASSSGNWSSNRGENKGLLTHSNIGILALFIGFLLVILLNSWTTYVCLVMFSTIASMHFIDDVSLANMIDCFSVNLIGWLFDIMMVGLQRPLLKCG